MRAVRGWLDGHGFIEMSTPILTPSAAEGTSNLFEVDYFDERAFLAQTGQLYSEATIRGLWQGVLLRSHVSRRAQQDPSAPD